MASLFKDHTIKEKLQDFEVPDFEEKFEQVQKWHRMYINGQLQESKEEALEAPFSEDIFGYVLGYIGIGNDTVYTKQMQPKVPQGGQKADIGLGFFDSNDANNDSLRVVVELKNAKTSLDKPQQREGNLTPVQQAFKYKPFFTECDFVMVSNFYETRLYDNNYYDYECFTLDNLIDPSDNYFQFRKFYYLLCAEHLISHDGGSYTRSLLSHIRIDQERITKTFYKEYKQLRQELIQNIVQNNSISRTKSDFLVSAAQKIIDRIVFIHFAEDIGLLPDMGLKEKLEASQDFGLTPWELLKKYFEAVDKGNERFGVIDGYNGELFKPDEQIDNLIIGDDICRKFIDVGRYDFSEDLSVNILGHIFEQSISDIEKLKNALEKNEDIGESKRKKDGIFYTPEYIVDYIVKNSLGKYLEEKEQEIKNKHGLKADIQDKNYEKRAHSAYKEYLDALQNVKVLDPACGSGAFLVKVFDFLKKENERVDAILAELAGGQSNMLSAQDRVKDILQNNIYGVDINAESVEITKLSLWLKSAQKGRKLADMSYNIKCGNSLIDDPEVAGDKAFVWEKEFAQIMANGGFDVVVGNPPYHNFSSKYSSVSDLDLEEKNIIEYCSDKYSASSNGCRDLYKWFLEKIIGLVNKGGVIGMITPNTWITHSKYRDIKEMIFEVFPSVEIFDLGDNVFSDATVPTAIFTASLFQSHKNYYKIWKQENAENIIFNKIGEQSLDNMGNIQSSNEIVRRYLGNNDFALLWDILTLKEWEHIPRSKLVLEGSMRVIDSKNMGRYLYIDTPCFYFDDKNHHFSITEGDRIIIRKTWDRIMTAITPEDPSFVIQNLYQGVDSKLDPYFLLAVLNSKFLTYIYQNAYFWQKGRALAQFRKWHLDKMPIPLVEEQYQTLFIEKADKMLTLNKEFQEQIQKFLRLIQGEYGIEKISRKLEKFWELEFDEFVKQLKTKLNMEQKEDLMDFFEKKKSEILQIRHQIDTLDSEIDQMVFDLYGLSEEERRVVLAS